MKLNRRRLLLAGLGAGVTISSTREHLRTRAVLGQNNLNALTDETLTDHISIMDAAYASEASWGEEVEKRKTLLSAANWKPPEQPYNREISKRLIQFCKLAVQQYKTGRTNPNYEGEIDLLPAYRNTLKNYSQVANFTIEEEIIEEYFKSTKSPNSQDILEDSTLDETIDQLELTLHDRVRQILQRKYRISVYSGIALTSKEHNILVFRGTQTQAEWLKNLNAAQKLYTSAASGQSYGEVHEGFLDLMQRLTPSLAEVAQQLDPTIPCYVTGHSLGAAIATLAAFELVQAVPQLKDQVRLYTFAGPRVCSPTFAKFHHQFVPNAYRIVNLGDTVPLVPPVTMGNSYVHIGQEWSFLAQFGDTLLNHVVDTYLAALDQEVETNQANTPMQRLKLE